MKVLCSHADPRSGDASYRRAVFSIQICQPTFDLIFNSKNGYRAWFFRSPYLGLRNNARLIRSLSEELLVQKPLSQMGESALDSLQSITAKVWLAERGNEPCFSCDGCAGEWSPPQDALPEILNGRWERNTHSHARWGRKAYYFTKLRILGGFVNAMGDEWIAGHKKHRAYHIHDNGWS